MYPRGPSVAGNVMKPMRYTIFYFDAHALVLLDTFPLQWDIRKNNTDFRIPLRSCGKGKLLPIHAFRIRIKRIWNRTEPNELNFSALVFWCFFGGTCAWWPVGVDFLAQFCTKVYSNWKSLESLFCLICVAKATFGVNQIWFKRLLELFNALSRPNRHFLPLPIQFFVNFTNSWI